MAIHELMVHPTHCFCEVPLEELRFWATKHFHDHIPTMELLHSTTNPHEKEVISMVAMLELDDDTMVRLMGQINRTDQHILTCRHRIQQMLELIQAV